MHCADGWCEAVCPAAAISRNPTTGAVEIDPNRCAGCKMCLLACPYGHVHFDPVARSSTQCDLCGGDPKCVQHCTAGSLTFVEAEEAADVAPDAGRRHVETCPASGQGRIAMSPGRETQKTLCRMCDDRCGIDVHLEDGRIVDIVGNAEHVWNRGRVCAKARGAVDMVYHPDRLLTPLKRTARRVRGDLARPGPRRDRRPCRRGQSSGTAPARSACGRVRRSASASRRTLHGASPTPSGAPTTSRTTRCAMSGATAATSWSTATGRWPTSRTRAAS